MGNNFLGRFSFTDQYIFPTREIICAIDAHLI